MLYHSTETGEPTTSARGSANGGQLWALPPRWSHRLQADRLAPKGCGPEFKWVGAILEAPPLSCPRAGPVSATVALRRATSRAAAATAASPGGEHAGGGAL